MKVTKKNVASTGYKQDCLRLENHEEIMKNDSDRQKKKNHRMTTENMSILFRKK